MKSHPPNSQVESSRDKTESDTQNEKHTPKKYLKNIFSFKNADQWWLVGLTFLILVITAWFNYRQINTYIDATHADLRAYLVIDSVTVDPIVAGKHLEFQLHITNGGKTPAYDVHPTRMLGVKIGLPLPEEETSRIHLILKSNDNVIGPGMHYALGANVPQVPFNDSAAALTYSGRKTLSLWGNLTYEDKFGQSHWVQYAVFLSPKYNFRITEQYPFYHDMDR
jgi:hypothetical protein